MGVMSGALGLELASVALRRNTMGVEVASPAAVGLAVAGGILCLGGGWLGGELVFRHGVNVLPAETEAAQGAGGTREEDET